MSLWDTGGCGCCHKQVVKGGLSLRFSVLSCQAARGREGASWMAICRENAPGRGASQAKSGGWSVCVASRNIKGLVFLP